MAQHRPRFRSLVMATLLATTTLPAYAATGMDMDAESLLDLSLSELSDIVVTSVSKKEEKLSTAPSAIFVVTSDDIRRSGATSIPEVLRLVPGVHVAKSGSNRWAITARGFNDQFANKLLVLMDGRTLYTPIFSGVFWDMQDTNLADIDRIEVIRGPGATLWGANAVNGVINIITKNAAETQGTMVETLYGNREHGTVTARYGGALSDETHYRAYAKYFNRDDSRGTAGHTLDDQWRGSRGGFRLDWDNQDHTLMVQGDAYQQELDNTLRIPSLTAPFFMAQEDVEKSEGAHVLAHWDYDYSEQSSVMLQSYVDYVKRRYGLVELELLTLDAELQQSWRPNKMHDIVWGIGVRHHMDDNPGSYYVNFTPQDEQYSLVNAFVQDRIMLLEDQLYMTLGTKLEWNEFSGMEYQPSGRLSWIIDEGQHLWAAVSRAVKTPTRATVDVNLINGTFPGTPPAFIRVVDGEDPESEAVFAYELGYRIEPTDSSYVDIATFYNDYSNVTSSNPSTPFVETNSPLPPHLVIPAIARNDIDATSYGVEVAMEWRPYSNWRLAGSYSYLHLDLSEEGILSSEEQSPLHLANLRSYLNLTDTIEFDQLLYYTGSMSNIGIDDYLRLDARLAWQVMDRLEVSVVGQNLLDDWHQEFTEFVFNGPSEIGRSYYARLHWQF